MNTCTKLAMAALCLILGSCGLTNPYKKWLDDSKEDQNRLRPSALKAVLCDVGTWKVDYDGTDVYFQFGSDWSLSSDSEVPQIATSSTYNLMSVSPEEISLTLVGGGHISYVESGADETYIVKEFSAQSVSATGKTSGKAITFVPGDEEALAAIEASKAAMLVTVEACRSFISAGFKTAAVHKADGTFVGRFTINPEPRTIKLDLLEGGTLTHTSVEVEADDNSDLIFTSSLTLGGETVTGLVAKASGIAFQGGDNLVVKTNADSRGYFLGGDYHTHALNVRADRGEAVQYVTDELTPHDEWGDIELSDRETRPLVFCPENDQAHYWYTFFDSFKEEDGAKVSSEFNDIIFMSKSDGYMPFGGWDDGNGGEFDNAAEIMSTLPRFMNGYFHKDGLILVHDFDDEGYSYIWVLSPTTDFWLRARD